MWHVVISSLYTTHPPTNHQSPGSSQGVVVCLCPPQDQTPHRPLASAQPRRESRDRAFPRRCGPRPRRITTSTRERGAAGADARLHTHAYITHCLEWSSLRSGPGTLSISKLGGEGGLSSAWGGSGPTTPEARADRRVRKCPHAPFSYKACATAPQPSPKPTCT